VCECLQTGFGLVIGFTKHLQIITIANSHPLQFSRAYTKSQFAFTSPFLVKDPNNALCLHPYGLANVSQLTRLRVTLLGYKPLETHGQTFFLQLNSCGHSLYVTSSLTRGWVCRLELLLGLTSAVILKSESSGTHDHILPSQIRDSPNLVGQVPVFISPRNRVAKLYTQALGSLFVASYDFNWLNSKFVPRITLRHGPHRKHCSSVGVWFFPWEHVYFRSRYSVTAFAYLLISRSLPSNVSTCYNINHIQYVLPQPTPTYYTV
jgi:hypothetical protein